MRLISSNIDSLNAALTSDSPRAQLTRSVLNTIKEKDADIIAIQETKLLVYFYLIFVNILYTFHPKFGDLLIASIHYQN